MREFNPNQKHKTSKHTVKSNHTLSIRKKRDTPKTHFALNRTTFSDSSLSISCSANYRLALFHSLFLFLSLSLSLWLLQSFRIGNFCVGFTSLILIYIVSFHLLLLDDSFFIRCCCCISLIAIAHLSNFHMCTNGNQNITRGWKWKRSQIFDHDHYFVVFHSFSLPPSLWISLLTLHIFISLPLFFIDFRRYLNLFLKMMHSLCVGVCWGPTNVRKYRCCMDLSLQTTSKLPHWYRQLLQHFVLICFTLPYLWSFRVETTQNAHFQTLSRAFIQAS